MYRFAAQVWEWQGPAAWVFVTLPPEIADEIEAGVALRPGFGSVPVEVEVGGSRWSTSLFPDKASASYVLPLKRAVRTAEGIEVGDVVSVRLVPTDT